MPRLFLIVLLTAVLYFLTTAVSGTPFLPRSLPVPAAQTAEVWPRLINGARPDDVEAKAYAAAVISKKDGVRMLLAKDSAVPLPVASITKLMTAMVFLDYYDPTKENYDLLYPLLIESDNKAAIQLTRSLGEEKFVELMNKKAGALGLSNTFFYNATGLDPAPGQESYNRSTAADLIGLARVILTGYRSLVDISRFPEYDFWQGNGRRHLTSTNALLAEDFPGFELLGGKTGSTALAQKNIVLFFEHRTSGNYLVLVVLGSPDHFVAARRLFQWLNQAYVF